MTLPTSYARPQHFARKVKRIPAEEAAKIRVELQVFGNNPTDFPNARLLYLLDILSPWYENGYCGSFEYFKYRRALTAERSKRLNTR